MRFRLAAVLGCSEGEIKQRLSAAELFDWQLLEGIEPWGERRADYRAAVICWVIASYLSSKGRRPRFGEILKLFDFEKPREQSDEELNLLFKQMTGKK